MLYFYLASIATCFFTDQLVSRFIIKEAKNRGYKIKKEKNIYKSIINLIKTLGISAIPIFNLIIAGLLIAKSDKLCEETIKDKIKEGKFLKIEDEEIISDKIIKDESSQMILYNVNSEITREQKIEFLKQEYSRLTGEDLNNLEKRKGRQKRR